MHFFWSDSEKNKWEYQPSLTMVRLNSCPSHKGLGQTHRQPAGFATFIVGSLPASAQLGSPCFLPLDTMDFSLSQDWKLRLKSDSSGLFIQPWLLKVTLTAWPRVNRQRMEPSCLPKLKCQASLFLEALPTHGIKHTKMNSYLTFHTILIQYSCYKMC